MFLNAEELPSGSAIESDVTIVGAGGAGILIALELAKAGLQVALIESGGPAYSPRIQALADTDHFNPKVHAPMSECTRRQIGGTSAIWGGRVVPFDKIDFDERDFIPDSHWPLTYEQLSPHFARVCEFLRAGCPKFTIDAIPRAKHRSIVPGSPDGDVLTSTLERWSVLNLGKEYEGELKRSNRIKLVHHLTCTEIECAKSNGNRVNSILAKTLNGREIRLKSKKYILACGALNATRLLLSSDRLHHGGIGNHSRLLGKFYQGHVSGRIAEVHFSTPTHETAYGFDRDEIGVYARRRFSFARDFLHKQQMSNIVAWLVNSEISNPAHGNGVLSFAHLILSSPLGKYLASEAIRKATIKGAQGRTRDHFMNMLRDLPNTAMFIPTFGYKRFLAKRKVPGFFQYSRSNVYNLHYFGEQFPLRDSCISLVDEKDELGMRKIKIDLRYSAADVQNVIEAHKHWDAHLQRHNCGRLKYIVDDVEQSIWSQAGDGFHQVGSTRMSDDPLTGVVGPDCNVHGFDDLFVASSSAFVTAGQANSMFMILVLALRVSEHLKATTSR